MRKLIIEHIKKHAANDIFLLQHNTFRSIRTV